MKTLENFLNEAGYLFDIITNDFSFYCIGNERIMGHKYDLSTKYSKIYMFLLKDVCHI